MPSDLPGDLQIVVEPVQYPRLDREQLRAVVRDHPAVAAFLDGSPGHRLRISEPDVLGREPDAHAPFEATVFDPAGNRAVRVRGRLDRPHELEVRPSGVRPTPSRAELREAAAVLRAQPGFPTGDGVLLYRPMPPLADVHRPDGTVTRRPTLGVYDPHGSPRHRVVAVDLAARTVGWEPGGVDAPTDADCEGRLPVPVDALDDPGGPARVRVRVVRGGVELWDLVVVRPRDSEPQALGKGSGVELRQVRHRGRLVLSRAHVPILNVRYDDSVSFRSWRTPRRASTPSARTPGSRVPGVHLAAGDDPRGRRGRGNLQGGNFQGVALHYESGELRIVSEVEAGWYRYVSDWRLRDDGVIKPRFGFAGTRNPMTCKRHQHHVYWRLDFDIEGEGSEVVTQRGRLGPGNPAEVGAGSSCTAPSEPSDRRPVPWRTGRRAFAGPLGLDFSPGWTLEAWVPPPAVPGGLWAGAAGLLARARDRLAPVLAAASSSWRRSPPCCCCGSPATGGRRRSRTRNSPR